MNTKKSKSRQSALHKMRTALGRCVECGTAPAVHGIRCTDCRLLNKSRTAEWRANKAAPPEPPPSSISDSLARLGFCAEIGETYRAAVERKWQAHCAACEKLSVAPEPFERFAQEIVGAESDEVRVEILMPDGFAQVAPFLGSDLCKAGAAREICRMGGSGGDAGSGGIVAR